MWLIALLQFWQIPCVNSPFQREKRCRSFRAHFIFSCSFLSCLHKTNAHRLQYCLYRNDHLYLSIGKQLHPSRSLLRCYSQRCSTRILKLFRGSQRCKHGLQLYVFLHLLQAEKQWLLFDIQQLAHDFFLEVRIIRATNRYLAL